MTEILSQEEINALLSAGAGDTDEEDSSAGGSYDYDDDQQDGGSSAGAYSMHGDSAPSFDAMYGGQTAHAKSNVKRTSKLDEKQRINVQPANFPEFDLQTPADDSTELGTILNIQLDLRVELGKTTSSIRDVLEMGSGSVLELAKQNGEPVDLIVNKKNFAKGEMIVIGENFGVRVTDILSVHELIEALR